MGIFSFLPKVNNCFYYKNLAAASILIVIFSMFAAVHSIKIAYYPGCADLYDETWSPIYPTLILFKWIVILINLMVIFSAFALLIGIFLSYPVTADVFIACGIIAAISAVIFAILAILEKIFSSYCSIDDVFFLFFYSMLWIYFILVIASYSEQMNPS